MKSNQEILDEFGKILIENAYDFSFSIIKENIDEIVREYSESIIFNLLKIFEENEQFKLIFEENGKQVDLVKISEMLKAEPLGENGWIKRFSKYAEKKGVMFQS